MPRALRIGSAPLPRDVRKEVDPEDPELEAAKQTSRKQMVKDEAKHWAMVLADIAWEQKAALEAHQAAVLEEPQTWWQAMDVDLPPC